MQEEEEEEVGSWEVQEDVFVCATDCLFDGRANAFRVVLASVRLPAMASISAICFLGGHPSDAIAATTLARDAALRPGEREQ